MKLKELRKEKKLTQEEVSKDLNLVKRTYFNYENELREPDIATLIKLADYFDVTVDELIGHEAPKNELTNIRLTDNQKYAIGQLLRLNEMNLLLATSYCKGLYATQKK